MKKLGILRVSKQGTGEEAGPGEEAVSFRVPHMAMLSRFTPFFYLVRFPSHFFIHQQVLSRSLLEVEKENRTAKIPSDPIEPQPVQVVPQ